MNDRDPNQHTHSPEVERAALAVVLDGRNVGAWETLIQIVRTPLAFYVSMHQHIALACGDLAAQGGRIDVASLAEHLSHTRWGDACDRLAELDGQRRARKFDDGQVAYEESALASLGGYNALDLGVAHVGALKRNAEIIATHHRQRIAIAAYLRAADLLRMPNGVRKLAEVVDETTTRTLSADSGASEGTIGEGVRAALAQHDGLRAGTTSRRCASWGIPAMDEAVELSPGSLTTVAGVTGGGKTSLVLGAIEATAALHGPGSVAMVSLEMSRRELGAILLARKLRVTRRKIDRGHLRADEREMASEHIAYFDGLGAVIRDKAERNTAADIRTWAIQRQRISGGALVLLVVDHVGLVSRSNPRASTLDAVSEAYQNLKAFALAASVAVILLNQYNREGAKSERGRDGLLKPDPKPRLQDLKLGGEADSDNVVMLWRPSLDSGPRQERIAVIPKCRSGPQTEVPLIFEPALGQRFYDPNQRNDPDRRPNPALHTEPTANEGAVWNS